MAKEKEKEAAKSEGRDAKETSSKVAKPKALEALKQAPTFQVKHPLSTLRHNVLDYPPPPHV